MFKTNHFTDYVDKMLTIFIYISLDLNFLFFSLMKVPKPGWVFTCLRLDLDTATVRNVILYILIFKHKIMIIVLCLFSVID